MTTRARSGELTLDEYLANARNGVLDDRIEAFMPADLYGEPAAATRDAGHRNGTVKAARKNGRANSKTGRADASPGV